MWPEKDFAKKHVLFEKSDLFCSIFRTLSNKYKFWLTFLGRFVKSQSGCPEEFFWESFIRSTFSFHLLWDLVEQILFSEEISPAML